MVSLQCIRRTPTPAWGDYAPTPHAWRKLCAQSSAECPDACEKANFPKAEPKPRNEMRLLEVKASGFTEARCTDLHHIRLDRRVGHLHNSCDGPQDCFQQGYPVPERTIARNRVCNRQLTCCTLNTPGL